MKRIRPGGPIFDHPFLTKNICETKFLVAHESNRARVVWGPLGVCTHTVANTPTLEEDGLEDLSSSRQVRPSSDVISSTSSSRLVHPSVDLLLEAVGSLPLARQSLAK